MKKRITCLIMVLCLLISVLPVSASAATAYELYINDFQFTSDQKTYSTGGGTATYQPDTKTLTIRNMNLTSGMANAVIYSDIDSLKIVVDGTNTITLRDSYSYAGQNVCTAMQNYALLANHNVSIVGKSGNPATDQLIINSKSVGVSSPLEDGTTRIGVYSYGTLNMENVTLSMTDSSTGDYAGHASMIRAGGKTTITGCRLDAQKCQLGLYMNLGASAILKNTVFSMDLNGASSSALNFTPSTSNRLENCTGTIRAVYPLYTYGATTVTGSGKLTLRASNMAAVVKQYGTGVAGGSLTFENANVELHSENTGIQVEGSSSLTVSGGTVDVTAAQAINLYDADSKLSLTAGRLKLTGLSTGDSVGISTKGAVEVTGGTLETSTVNSAIQNLGTKTVLFTGGTHTLTATAAGYADNAAGTLQIGGSADVTVNAAIGIRLSQGKGGKLNLTGGEVKLNSSSSGLQTQSGAGKTTLSGGKLTVTDTNEEPNIYGIEALGETEFSGTTVSFRNCKYDIRSGNGNNKITGGRVNLSGQIGLFAVGNFTVAGGELFSSCSTYGILSANGTVSLKGGKIRMEDKNYDIIAFQKSVIDFAGADVEAKSAEHFALAIYDEESSYQVTGGTVVLQSIQSGANKLYTALADGYGVWAGASAESAVRVANVTESTLQTNKYVRIAKIQSYTLTLVNVREGTSASVTGGDTVTYTAKDAPAGQHFSHWTLTVNGSTEEAGTDATYSGKMPDADATLTAVYEDCRGGTATCTEKATCEVCGRSYGEPLQHSYTAEIAEEQYLKSAADCENAAVYYKSCTGCGASSKGTEAEATFTHADPLGHDYGAWISNGNGTHTHTCSRDKSHTETKDCHGGTADCTHKAVCEDCGAQYGETSDHNYTAETAEEQYLKSAADCENAAVYYKSCTGCGASSKGTEDEATFTHADPLGHIEIIDSGIEPTCVDAGLSEGKHCERCGKTLIEQFELEALGHDVPDGTVLSDPTCSKAGEIIGTCTRCGAQAVSGSIPKLPHTEVKLPEVLASCTENGWTEGVKCSACGEILQGHTPIAPLAHQVVIDPETETLTEGKHCSVCGEILLPQLQKTGAYWTDEGNYDAALYASDPGNWVIEDAADLAALAKKVADGCSFAGFTVTLAADIDLSAHIWVPIGQVVKFYDRPPMRNCFSGIFLGNLHQITGMRVIDERSLPANSNVGLFGSVEKAEIRDLLVSGDVRKINRSGSADAGGIVGSASDTVLENCGFVGSVYIRQEASGNYNQYAGGIVGLLSDSTLSNCFAISNIEIVNPAAMNFAGGIAGNVWGFRSGATVENVYSVCNLSEGGIGTSDGICADSAYTTFRSCFSRLGFNASGAALITGTSCTDECMKALTGTKNDNVPCALVDSLNQAVLAYGGEHTRAWIVDPDRNNGYPTFASAVRFQYPQTELEDTMQVVLPGECAEQPEDPVYQNYNFLGWYADAEFTTPFDFSQKIYETVTVYAKFLDPNHPHQFEACILGADGLHDHVCTLCGKTYDCEYRVEVVDPTCQSAGYTVHTCQGCGSSYLDAIVEGGHVWTKTVHEPTHTEMGYTHYSCERCGEAYDADYIEPSGHTFDEGTLTRAATCTAEGEMTYTCSCGATHTVPVPMAAHELESHVTAPTCTELGFTTHACKHCEYSYTDSYVGALGHDWDEGTVASAPSLTETGTLIQHCTRCDATLESKIPMLTTCDGGEGCPSSAYIDVPDVSNWAHVGIDFVLKSGLFYGTSDTTFSPDIAMTRAMLVTVLYRLEGRPGVTTENPFTDVPDGKWYTEAVIWAAEKGVVAGIGDGRFAPDASVTREQIAVILRSYSAYKGYDTTARADLTTFPDHGEVSGWAYEAMSWANAAGLIAGAGANGTSYLMPKREATRAQVATILMGYVKTIVSK